MKVSTPPTNLLPLLAISLISIGVGYHLGNLYPRPLDRLCRTRRTYNVKDVNEPEEDDGIDNEIDGEGIPDGDLSAVKTGLMGTSKMVLVVRGDLNLSKNEIASYQATLSCYKSLSKANKPLLQHWERTAQTKIALRAKSESHLLELEAKAKSLNLCARIVRVAHHNEVKDIEEPESSSAGTGSCSRDSTLPEANSDAPASISTTGSSTPTVLAIGPAPVELVNEVTGKLRLF